MAELARIVRSRTSLLESAMSCKSLYAMPVLIVVMAVATALAGCGSKEATKAPSRPPPQTFDECLAEARFYDSPAIADGKGGVYVITHDHAYYLRDGKALKVKEVTAMPRPSQ